MVEREKKEGECPAIPTPRPPPQQQRQPESPQRHTGTSREQPPPGRPSPPPRPGPAGPPQGPQSQRAGRHGGKESAAPAQPGEQPPRRENPTQGPTGEGRPQPQCAAQLNQDCSPTRPCDHHKGLECNHGNSVTMAWAKSEGRTCEFNGRIYQSGESFRAGCKHHCTCMDGAVGCSPLCSNKLPPPSPSCPYPQLVRSPGQCCFSVDCRKDAWFVPPGNNAVMSPPSAWKSPQEKTCLVWWTDWSQCSRSCGMGVSSRITNDNARCEPETETRICTVRPCGGLTVPAKVGLGRALL
uniref:VWFC domain-containing protein n=1 Tax=Oryzias latipes TaxID=8090 RepID=A0A3P9JN76_ORYLA